MIQKKIHYCWFGKSDKSDSILYCINSWHKYMPDFEIKEWNEGNFNINDSNNFVKEAYKNKKWAFVSDYVRAYVLYKEGGFYLDTDMEVRNSLLPFIKHKAVCGFEIKGIPFSAFFGIEKGHNLAKDMKEYYENNNFSETPNTNIFSKLLVEKYGAIANKDEYQYLKEDIALYPSHYFSLDIPKNYVIHHFSGSWHDSWTDENNTYKDMVNTYGILKQLINLPNSKKKINDVVYNHKLITIDQILNQIPLRFILKYIFRQIKLKLTKS